MSLRLKIVLALMLLAAVSTAAVGAWSYRSTRNELEHAVNRSLTAAALRTDLEELARQSANRRNPRPRAFDQIVVQALDADGDVISAFPGQSTAALPVARRDIAVATSGSPLARVRHDIVVDGEPFRVLTVRSLAGGAIMLARSLQETENSLDAIQRHTLWAVAIALLVSALIGWLLGRQLTRRLVRLTDAAATVASTGRLDVPVPTDGSDETAQLGVAFSAMLEALARSRMEQTRLVQDAGHELRTPLTSVRTNVSVLRDFERLAPEERARLLADLDSESRELSVLVDELVELASDRRDAEPVQRVELAEVAERAAARTRRRSGRDVTVRADTSAVDGQLAALERAAQNLIDNAAKFAPDGPIEVTVNGGTLSVRDHGAGISPADLPRVFDRFFRAVDQRSQPGSGLGLSIVKSVVEAHHGTVFAGNADGGGAIVGFSLTPS